MPGPARQVRAKTAGPAAPCSPRSPAGPVTPARHQRLAAELTPPARVRTTRPASHLTQARPPGRANPAAQVPNRLRGPHKPTAHPAGPARTLQSRREALAVLWSAVTGLIRRTWAPWGTSAPTTRGRTMKPCRPGSRRASGYGQTFSPRSQTEPEVCWSAAQPADRRGHCGHRVRQAPARRMVRLKLSPGSPARPRFLQTLAAALAGQNSAGPMRPRHSFWSAIPWPIRRDPCGPMGPSAPR